MSERPSLWSQKVRSEWLVSASCPACGETNRAGTKPAIELDEEQAWCSCCGKTFPVQRPRVEPVG